MTEGYNDAKARKVVRFSRLPERHNDMVFSVIVARFGLLGGLAVVGLYGVWLTGALLTAAASREAFGRLMIVGFAAILTAQVVINIGMNVGIVPIIGLTLPFVSYGGSSMLTVWVMTGLVVGVGLRRPGRMAREEQTTDQDGLSPASFRRGRYLPSMRDLSTIPIKR
jgi:rod shape determining protein RodA